MKKKIFFLTLIFFLLSGFSVWSQTEYTVITEDNEVSIREEVKVRVTHPVQIVDVVTLKILNEELAKAEAKRDNWQAEVDRIMAEIALVTVEANKPVLKKF